MPDRKESGAREGRKPNSFGIKVGHFSGLAAAIVFKMSRVAQQVKSGWLDQLGAEATVAIRWKSRETIMLREVSMYG